MAVVVAALVVEAAVVLVPAVLVLVPAVVLELLVRVVEEEVAAAVLVLLGTRASLAWLAPLVGVEAVKEAGG